MTMLDGARGDLDVWLTPFLAVLGRKTRRSWAPFYVRGLLGPSERKSLQPMALQLGLADMTSCSTSSPARLGMMGRYGRCWRSKRTGWSAGRMRCG
jgi:hypothetical protein